MGRPLQAKLLRFLEDGTFARVGGTQELRVSVRLIAATNRDIVRAISQGEFREDLFHRLNVVQVQLPPLRERGEDVLLLATHFLKTIGVSMNKNTRSISKAARQKLLRHHWPGNVRELRNVIERALILETDAEIQPSSLPEFKVEAGLTRPGGFIAAEGASLDEIMANFERDLITSRLERNAFNVARTSDELKISRHALRYRMRRLNVAADLDNDGDIADGEMEDTE
jgi:transcriptional regulator with PAS, ATPase and Fis domain